MTKIDFYVLPEDGSLPTAVAIGRLAEKASARGHQVFIQTKDSQDALQLDEALWAFRPSSFVPHSLATERGPERVIIGHEDPPMECERRTDQLDPFGSRSLLPLRTHGRNCHS
jgi:DNA polymerase-3 subunit chi